MKKKKITISNNVIRRLPRYIRKLDELIENGTKRISSAELGALMGLTPSQIRQDFSCFGEFGQQGYGYNIQNLRNQIASILGTDRGHTAILIGVGKIGRALMDNFCFEQWGVNLTCAFDNRQELVGTVFNGIPVCDEKYMATYISEHKTDIAVLTVPKGSAVSVANSLKAAGIKAIWNFTNTEIAEPNSDMIIENIHFSDSLLCLSYYLSENQSNNFS